MQNRYSGDIGDYSKFVLLHELFSANSHRICLVRYLYPDESHTSDGRHTAYLDNEAYSLLSFSQAAKQIRNSLKQFIDSICGRGWNSFVEI